MARQAIEISSGNRPPRLCKPVIKIQYDNMRGVLSRPTHFAPLTPEARFLVFSLPSQKIPPHLARLGPYRFPPRH